VRSRIAARLQGTKPVADPAAAALEGLPAGAAKAWFERPLVPAAVLIPVVLRETTPTVLLTRRTESLTDHPGQISFPGGRVEAGDRGAADTALRETREETGLEPRTVQIVGYLPPHAVVTGFAITPVVGFVEPGFALRPDPVEVAEVFEVPLDFFLEPANRTLGRRRFRDVEFPLVEYRYERRRIWGATAQILDSFITQIKT